MFIIKIQTKQMAIIIIEIVIIAVIKMATMVITMGFIHTTTMVI